MITIEDVQVSFDFLIYMFHFSIGLGVISSKQEMIIVEEFSKFSSEGRSKLRATIRDDFVIEAKWRYTLWKKRKAMPSAVTVVLVG